jgi:ankyrin repeat protein
MSRIIQLIDAGDVQGLRDLLGRQPEAAAGRDAEGLSVLMHAAYRGGEVFELVRAANPPLEPFDRILVGESDGLPAPDARTPDGFTPLHIAAFAHNVDAARRLLELGADPNVLATASFAEVSPLGTAATFGDADIAALLLEYGADPELTADHGGTPLHSAAANGFTEIVALLLAHGAKRDARTDAGKSPADVAKTDEIRSLVA